MNTALAQPYTPGNQILCNTAAFDIVQYQTDQPQDNNNADLKNLIRKHLQALITEARMWDIYCLNVQEAAIMLSVEMDTVRDWIKCGKLVASKPGREWLIRVADIEKLLKTNSNIISMDKRFNTGRRRIS